MRYLFFLLLFCFALLLETSFVQLPLVLLVLLSFIVIYQSEIVFIAGLFFGILLDALLFRAVGITSLFFLIFLSIIFLYQQKFELRTISFVFVFSFFGSISYLLFFGYTNLLVQTCMSSAVGVAIYMFVSLLYRRKVSSVELPSMVS